MSLRILKPIQIFVGLLCSVCLFGNVAFADLNFGVTPYLPENRIRVSYEPILAALAKDLNQPVNLVIVDNYQLLSQKIATREIDVGIFTPSAYIDAVEKVSVKLILSQLVKGEQPKKTLVFFRKACVIKTIGQIKGKAVAFVDPQSAYEYLYPRFQFNSNRKKDNLFFKKIMFRGSQSRVFDAVLEGTIDSGIITCKGTTEISGDIGIPIHELTTFVENEPILYHAYACRPDLSERLIKTIQAFFLTLQSTEEPLKKVLSNPKALQFERWVIANDSFAEIVRGTLALSRRKKKLAALRFKPYDLSFNGQRLANVVSLLFAHQLAATTHFHVIGRPVDGSQLEALRSKHLLDMIFTGNLIQNDRQIILDVKGIDIYSGKIAIQKQAICYKLEALNETVSLLAESLQKGIPLEASIEKVDDNLISVDGGLKEGFEPGAVFVVMNYDGKDMGALYPLGSTGLEMNCRIVADGRLKTVNEHYSIGRIEVGDMTQVNVGARIQTVESNFEGVEKSLDRCSAYLQGVHHLRQGAYLEAVDDFQKIIEYDPTYSMAYAELSTAYFNLNKNEQGMIALENAKKHLSPSMLQEKDYILAREATEKKDYISAIRFYLNTLNRYPHNTTALHNLGLIYMDSDYEGASYDMAMMYFQKALSFNLALNTTKSALEQACRLKILSDEGPAEPDAKMVDMVFAIDTTGSMESKLPLIARKISECIDDISQKAVNLNLGMVTFGPQVRQIYCRRPDQAPPLVNSSGQYKSRLKRLIAYGGGDEDLSGAITSALQYEFRPGAKAILVLVTDGSVRSSRLEHRPIDSLLKMLSAKAVTVFIVGINDSFMREIAEKTGGGYIDIKGYIDFKDIVEYADRNIIGRL